MVPKQPPYEPIEFKMDVSNAPRHLKNLHWYVLGSAVMFALTALFVTTSVSYLTRMSVIGSLYMALVLAGIRIRRSTYIMFIGWPLFFFGLGLGRGTFGDWWTPAPTVFGAFFLPLLLIWIGRRWVVQFCRLEETAAPKE